MSGFGGQPHRRPERPLEILRTIQIAAILAGLRSA
jgi:hypothetical protein